MCFALIALISWLGPWPCPWSFGSDGQGGRGVLAESMGLLAQDTQPVFWALTLSAAALPPLLGWHRLSATAYRYQRRELSDERIAGRLRILRSLPSFKRSPSSSTRPWAFSPASSHLPPDRIVVAFGMRATRGPTTSSRPVSPPLLRVFALGRRSERLLISAATRSASAGKYGDAFPPVRTSRPSRWNRTRSCSSCSESCRRSLSEALHNSMSGSGRWTGWHRRDGALPSHRDSIATSTRGSELCGVLRPARPTLC